jgi:HNH endonuclease
MTSGQRFDLIGQRFARLLVIERLDSNAHAQQRWRCQCDCGAMIVALTSGLRSGHTRSCGCYGRRHPKMATFLQDQIGKVGCWEYPSARTQDGYAVYSEKGHPRQAHQAAYRLTKGSLPEGFCACHSCDNPACCRPDHLFAGTRPDNNRDCIAKDRHNRGERVHTAKLLPEQVVAIRSDKRTRREIAAQYMISMETVSAIWSRRSWAHID